MVDRLLEFLGFDSRREIYLTVRRHIRIAGALYLLALGAFAVAFVIGKHC